MKTELFRYTWVEFCNQLQRCYLLSKAQTQVWSILLEDRHVTPWHHSIFQFRHFNTVFKHSCYHLNRSTMFLLDICFPLGLHLQDLKGKAAFSSLREVYISKLNAISYWHVSSSLAFFPIVTYISSSDRKFYAISFMILCNISTIKEIQYHRQKNSLFCLQTFNVKHHLPSHENMKDGISHALHVPQVGSSPHFSL